ncbi:MAG: DUF2911 domain-containing protein [Bacteroidota bacterium]
MTRMLFYLALVIFVLPQVVSCNAPQSSTEDNTDNTEQTTDDNTEDNAVAVPSTEPPSGDNFEIKELNGTIASPRKEMSGTVGNATITVNYGSPAVKGRTIYGDLVPYGKVWRTGANEATQITFNSDVVVGEARVPVPAGTYALFTIPEDKTNWTFIINTGSDLWGAYDYEQEKDVARVAGNAQMAEPGAERMDFSLGEDEVRLHWADLVVSFPVAAAK